MRVRATVAAALAATVAGCTAQGMSLPPGGAAAHAQEAELSDQGVTVAAVGTVEGTPDVLTAQVGVEVEAGSADEAYRQANEAAAEIRRALADAGVEDRDIQTAQLSLGRRHHRDPQGSDAGYAARTSLQARLRDLEAAGATIDEAVAAGGEHATLRSMGFSLDDDSALADDARQAAFDAARAKAEQYAELAGRSLGDLQGLSEDERGGGPPRPFDGGVAEQDAAASAPIEPGSQEVAVRVRATWALQ